MSTKAKVLATAAVVLLMAAAAWVALAPAGGLAPPNGGAVREEEGDEHPVVLAGGEAPTAPAESPPLVVRAVGTVVDARTGEPVAGARVLVDTGDRVLVDTGDRVLEATTGADGSLSLALPPTPPTPHVESGMIVGYHWIEVRAEGYATAFLKVNVPRHFRRQRLPRVALTPVAGRLTVEVRDPEGRPVPRAPLLFDLPSRNHRHGRLGVVRVCGEDGRFGPVAVEPGRTTVRARGPGLPEGIASVTFAPAGAVRDETLVVRLPEPVFAEGVSVDPEGGPLPGVRVVLLTWGTSPWTTAGPRE